MSRENCFLNGGFINRCLLYVLSSVSGWTGDHTPISPPPSASTTVKKETSVVMLLKCGGKRKTFFHLVFPSENFWRHLGIHNVCRQTVCTCYRHSRLNRHNAFTLTFVQNRIMYMWSKYCRSDKPPLCLFCYFYSEQYRINVIKIDRINSGFAFTVTFV